MACKLMFFLYLLLQPLEHQSTCLPLAHNMQEVHQILHDLVHLPQVTWVLLWVSGEALQKIDTGRLEYGEHVQQLRSDVLRSKIAHPFIRFRRGANPSA